MFNNPFTSFTFVSVWLKHFNNSKPSKVFYFINYVEFVKHKFLPFYINVGKNLTKGVYYSIDDKARDFKNKVFLIYDVPSYFNIKKVTNLNTSSLRLKTVSQYQGLLIDISKFENFEGYISKQFSTQNKRYIRWSHINRLENCFNISYNFFHGEISNNQYELIFNHFYRLLDITFSGKRTNYHHLNPKLWNFYKELVLPMIRERKASFFIIYDNEIPIAINLNFHSDNTLFKAITVYDVNYYRFSLGKLSVIKIIEWCFENNYRISDFTKGDFDYKHKWSNVIYDFNYHIFYDLDSVVSRITASCISLYFKFKSYLRAKKINVFYRKVIFKIERSSNSMNSVWRDYKTEKLIDFRATEQFKAIEFKQQQYSYLLSPIYSFLFANPEPIKAIKVFEDTKKDKTYIIVGSKIAQKTIFN
ncbi:MAG: hypothetical protein DRI75_11675 [Bacteroidetes bacterium]|nr:MAG: hypothetical protein DRI75_11675 [Bacteroidota bacterium]